ncbi:hypothetical protein EMPS_02618 [Entomortierella parvispora]|uniref:Uncharacterized protein n=1 Tax=Entomortierella parvispora TaxID=205924 RepID=A0A9P3LTU8_9FUNG|nr:hypothetical protein EMPS_02618 [Entomortierella parvispora]
MVVAVAQPAAINPSSAPLEHEDNYVQQLWHSLEEALHLREPVPPPVPPKDERWMVRTVDLSISPQDEDDVHFWEKLTSKLTSRYHHYILQQEESVSIDVPTEAALNHLGNQGTEDQQQQRRAYFKRMSRLCQQKFEHDNEIALQEQQEAESLANASTDIVQEHHHRHHRMLSNLKDRLHGRRHSADLSPRIDPEEMRAAHRLLYGQGNDSTSSVSLVLGSRAQASESEDSWGRSMFGLWWGHRRHGNSETKDTLGEDDWEKVDVPKHKADQRESLREQNGLVPALPAEPEPQSQSQTHRHHIHLGRRTPKIDASVLGSSLVVDHKGTQKSTLKRHQALAAAAAYEAMKAYQAKKIRQGKKVSHGEIKAILAGMAMAEAVKLLESKHHSDNDNDGNDDDDAVAEAGSKVLKLFELWRSP